MLFFIFQEGVTKEKKAQIICSCKENIIAAMLLSENRNIIEEKFVLVRELETNNRPILDDYLFPAP